jgi:hypothetical protein
MHDHRRGGRAARLHGQPRGAHRLRAVRTVVAFLLVGSSVVLVTASPAIADDVTGGCTGTINGRDASTLTPSDPVSVKEGQAIEVAGDIPPNLVNQNPNSFTTVKVDLLAGVGGVTSEEHKSTGATYQGENIDVDDYLQYGAGVYEVHVTNEGSGWKCEFTGYVKMDTNPLGAPIGLASLAALVIGGVGVVLAKGRPRRPRRDWFDRLLSDDERAARDDTLRAAHDADPALRMVEEVRYAPVGPPWILAAVTLPLVVMPVVGTAGGGVGVPRATGPRVVWQQFAWKRGHAVLGLLAGGLLGVGIGVLGWQYSLWLFSIWIAFVLPVVLAVTGALYAWYGRRYVGRVTVPVAPTGPAVDDDGPEPDADAGV